MERLAAPSRSGLSGRRVRTEVKAHPDSANETGAEIANSEGPNSESLDRTTILRGALPGAGIGPRALHRSRMIVAVNGRSNSPIDLAQTNVPENSPTDRREAETHSVIDQHSKIAVVIGKVSNVQSALEAHAKALVNDRSPRVLDRAPAASAGLNPLVVQVIRGGRTTGHAADVPDTLSSSLTLS